ncbi:polysaccharide pyruvyl transferase family protein [Streptomyces capparidis]
MTAPGTRVLLTGWFSFLHGEATAGDVLAQRAVAAALERARIPCDTAWSPGFRPDALHLDGADPAAYTHLVFACGPLHARPPAPGEPSPLMELHRRYARCRRVAVGITVTAPADPAVTGFHRVLPRDGTAAHPVPDLALHAPRPDAVPVAGVVLTGGQHEYGGRRRHAEVARALTRWLGRKDLARLPLDTRLDTRDWRLPATPGQLRAVLARLDAVVTNRLHGLVLGLEAGVPVLAVDPVAGGAKVTAQAAALRWPAALPAEAADDEAALEAAWRWCRSAEGLARAASFAAGPPAAPLLAALLAELGAPA